MISDTIQNQIKESLKANEQVRLSTLRMLSSELHNAEISKLDKLTGEEELIVVRKEIKKRKDAIEAYTQGGRPEKAQQESEELKILQEYLPDELTDTELLNIVEEAITESSAQSLGDIGRVMGLVMKKTQGRADGSRVSNLVKEQLNKK